MTKFRSFNPYSGEDVGSYTAISDVEMLSCVARAQASYATWRQVPLQERVAMIARAGQVLRDNLDQYARMITLEMGKPITESRAEVNKCALVCDYYAQNAAAFLADEIVKTDAQKSFVRHDPIGCVLAIMPWNFPFWQVFRFAAPCLTAGNVGLLKHAPNVFGSATLIVDVFRQAGFPSGVFQQLVIDHSKLEDVIAHPAVRAVTLTGSERAGSAVAALAGKYLKRSVLELGGNNAFIVCEDADIDQAVKTAITARMLNCGQSCIAAKRFILVGKIYQEFTEKFIGQLQNLKSGDPLDEGTQVGPLARRDLADQLQRQLVESVSQGAQLLYGGSQRDCYHEPTVLGQVTETMPAFFEETFGPLAAMIPADDVDEAFRLSEQSRYGLGVTVCTTNIEKALCYAERVSDGAYFVNELVKSDPRLPFGGEKTSGYGRELAKDGMMEFVNRKAVYVK